MHVATVLIFLSLCSSLALPVPVDRSVQARDEREISIDELESQLEEIENHINAVRTKVKEEAQNEKVDGIKEASPTPSNERTSERKTEAEEASKTSASPTTIPTAREREPETKTPTPLITKFEAETVKPSRPLKTEEEVKHSNKEVTVISVNKISNEGKKVAPVGEQKELEEETDKKKEKFEDTKKIEVKAVTNDKMEEEEAALEGEDRKTPGKDFVVTKITEKTKKLSGKSMANDGVDEEEADLESERQTGGSITVEKVSTDKNSAKLSTKVEKATIEVEKISSSSTPSKNTQKATVVKVERVPSRGAVEAKRSPVEQEDEEDEDLKEDKVQTLTDGEKEITIKVEKLSAKESPSEKKTTIMVQKTGSLTDQTKSEASVKKVAEKPVVKSMVRDEPHKGKITESAVKKSEIPVVKEETLEETEEEDLNSSENKEKHAAVMDERRSHDESQKTDEEIELELEGGQDKEERKSEKGQTDEQKVAHDLDKALKAERNREEEKPITAQSAKPTTPSETTGIAKVQKVEKDKGRQTIEVKRDEAYKERDIFEDETASEEEDSKRVLSDEEMELAELAQNAKNVDDKEGKEPVTEKPTISTPKEIVVTVNKIPKVTAQVIKEKSKMPLSKEVTKKEEKKLKEELQNEQEQEKAAAQPVIVKVEKLGNSPGTKPKQEEKKTVSKEALQEAELEDEAEA